MSEPTETERQIRELVATHLKVVPERVPLDSDLLEEMGLDSYDFMDAMLEIEELFPPVSLSDKSAEDLRTIHDLALYIDRVRAVE